MTRDYVAAIQAGEFVRRIGRVRRFFGSIVEADGPDVRLGEKCEIYSRIAHTPILAEVVGIRDGRVLLVPYGSLQGIRFGSEVVATGKDVDVPVGEALLGRVVDAFGVPLDQKGPLAPITPRYALDRTPMNPLERPRIRHILETGVKTIDTLLTLGRGQRVGIFAGSGVGKSTLLGMIARNMDADVNVIAMIGERGREVLEFIETVLGKDGLAKSVIVVATSEQPALVRTHAALAATSIAEYFRDQGRAVVLTMDSVTRFAMAQRELGLAVGEPPTARGYTPSVFSMLPRLLERAGTSHTGGSITALYTVLVEGDDFNEPIADAVRAIVDGAIVLTRDLAHRRQFPAIDVLQSNSRLMASLVAERENQAAKRLIERIYRYEQSRDLIDMGAYRSGSNELLDRAVQLMPKIENFMSQSSTEKVKRSQALQTLLELAS